MEKMLTSITMISILAIFAMQVSTAHGNQYKPEAYTVVYPTGDPKQDEMNIRQAVDEGGKVLLKSHDREGNPQHFDVGVLDHLKKECTLYLENLDGAMRVLRVRAEAQKSPEVRDHSVRERKPSRGPSVASVNTLQLYPVTVLEGTEGYMYHGFGLVSRSPTTSIKSGIDIDSDHRREIVFKTKLGSSPQPSQIYESVGDDIFQGYTTPIDRWYSKAVGDADSDGLQEIITGEFDHGPWTAVIGVYEQPDPISYPSAKTTEFLAPGSGSATPPVDIAIDDLDSDHRNEIIYAITNPGHFAVHECRGDNIYEQVYLASEPGFLLQHMAITVDLDNDGWKEAIVGGLPYLIMYEAWTDDSYRVVWGEERERNISCIRYVGDSDGDGLKEFLVGSAGKYHPGPERCTLYEFDGNGGFDITWEVSAPWHVGEDSGPRLEAVDLDGDGNRELLCTRRIDNIYVFEIYKSTGDNQYELIFSSAGVTGDGLGIKEGPIGVGDFDRDNKMELVLTEDRGGEDYVIAVYETAQAITSNVLRLTAGYKATRLCLGFTLGVPARRPAQGSIRWFTALLMPIGPSWQWVPITNTIVPPILPSKDFPIAFPFPQMGLIGVFSSLISDDGIEAYAFELVDTGETGLEKAIDREDILSELPSSEAVLRALRY